MTDAKAASLSVGEEEKPRLTLDDVLAIKQDDAALKEVLSEDWQTPEKLSVFRAIIERMAAFRDRLMEAARRG